MKEINYFGFVWDEEKAKLNKEKHGLSFETAVHVFNDPFLCELYDEKHLSDEERYKYIGYIVGSLIVFVVATDRNNKTRIISARKATKKERDYYYENVKKLQVY